MGSVQGKSRLQLPYRNSTLFLPPHPPPGVGVGVGGDKDCLGQTGPGQTGLACPLAENGFLEDGLLAWAPSSRGETKPYLLINIPSSRREDNCVHAPPTLL